MYFTNNAKHLSISFFFRKAASTLLEPAGFLHLEPNSFQQVKDIGKSSDIAQFPLPVFS